MIAYLRNRAEKSFVVWTVLFLLTLCSLVGTISYPIFFMTPFLIGGAHTTEMLNAGISAVGNTAPLWFHTIIWGIFVCVLFIGTLVNANWDD